MKKLLVSCALWVLMFGLANVAVLADTLVDNPGDIHLEDDALAVPARMVITSDDPDVRYFTAEAGALKIVDNDWHNETSVWWTNDFSIGGSGAGLHLGYNCFTFTWR